LSYSGTLLTMKVNVATRLH